MCEHEPYVQTLHAFPFVFLTAVSTEYSRQVQRFTRSNRQDTTPRPVCRRPPGAERSFLGRESLREIQRACEYFTVPQNVRNISGQCNGHVHINSLINCTFEGSKCAAVRSASRPGANSFVQIIHWSNLRQGNCVFFLSRWFVFFSFVSQPEKSKT